MSYGTFSLEISNCLCGIIWSCSIWHYSVGFHYLMCYPVFLPWYCLHYIQYSLDIHISFLWSSILEIFSAMNSTFHFFHIHHLDFYLEKTFLPSNFERILRSNKLFKEPPIEIFFFENQDELCILWDLGFWILTTQPFYSYTLAYYKPIYLISIEFQSIDNNLGSPPKTLFLLLQVL